MKIRSYLSVVGVLACATMSSARSTERAFIDDVAQRVGLDLLTVGAAGNRGVLPSEVGRPKWDFDAIPANMGAVGYEYRINRLEVTNTQLAQFANAYWQVNEAGGGRRGDPEFANAFFYNNNPANPPNYVPLGGFENVGSGMSWYMAARFCNWLHNGAPMSAATGRTSTQGRTTRRPRDLGSRRPGRAVHLDRAVSPFRRRGSGSSLDEWVRRRTTTPTATARARAGTDAWAGRTSRWSQVGRGLGRRTPAPTAAASPWMRARTRTCGAVGSLDTSGGRAEWVEDKPVMFRLPDRSYVTRDHYVLRSSNGDLNYASRSDRFLTICGPVVWGLHARIAAAIPVPGQASSWASRRPPRRAAGGDDINGPRVRTVSSRPRL